MSKNTEQDVLSVIEKSLEVPSGTIDLDTVAESMEEWDSIGHLGILTALDSFFEGGIANVSEIGEATSIPKILDALRKHSLI
jgi:acyl carrier protein